MDCRRTARHNTEQDITRQRFEDTSSSWDDCQAMWVAVNWVNVNA